MMQRLLQSRGLAQIIALLVILAVDRAVSPQFFDLRMQDGRLFGSLIDVLNRGAPVALLALGMVLVIATRGIDLSVGAVMAISGAIAASLADAHGLPLALAAALGAGLLCGLWNGFLVAVLGIQADRRHLDPDGGRPGRRAAHHRGPHRHLHRARSGLARQRRRAWRAGAGGGRARHADRYRCGGPRLGARPVDRGDRRQRAGERTGRDRHARHDPRGLCLVRPVRGARRRHRRRRHHGRGRQQCRALARARRYLGGG
jgi:hypothetical protein